MKRTKQGSQSIFLTLPESVAKHVCFFLHPYDLNSLEELVELLLCFPTPYLSATLHAIDQEARLDLLETVLSREYCPVLDISFYCKQNGWRTDFVKLLLRSSKVEAFAMKYDWMDAEVACELLDHLEKSTNKAHSFHFKFKESLRPGFGERFVGEVVARDSVVLFLDVRHTGIKLTETALRECGLTRSLQSTPSLCYLTLRGVGLDTNGAVSLFRALARQHTVELLNVSENPIGDGAAYQLAKYLKQQDTLRFLMVCSVGVTAEGGCAIAKALEVNKTLDLLSMKDDNLGPASGTAFASMLKVNKTLRRLYLDYCDLGGEGCRDFIEAVSINKWLKHLKLNHNGIKVDDKLALLRIAKQRRVLEVLEVEDKNELSEIWEKGRTHCAAYGKNYRYEYSVASNYSRHLIAKSNLPSEDYVLRGLRPTI